MAVTAAVSLSSFPQSSTGRPGLLICEWSSMPANCPALLLTSRLLTCGKHSAPSRTPFRWIHKLFVFPPEPRSPSDRNRVRLRPDSPVPRLLPQPVARDLRYKLEFPIRGRAVPAQVAESARAFQTSRKLQLPQASARGEKSTCPRRVEWADQLPSRPQSLDEADCTARESVWESRSLPA